MIVYKNARFIIIFAALLAVTGFMFKKPQPNTFHTPPALRNVPQVLWAGLLPGYSKNAPPDEVVTKAQYLAEQLAFIRFNGRDDATLSEQDYQDKIDQDLRDFRDQRIKGLREDDLDGDGRITLDEAVKSKKNPIFCLFSDKKPCTISEEDQKNAKIRNFELRDKDGDGVVLVDYPETPPRALKTYKAKHALILEYTKLDPNGDKILTSDELQSLAEGVFERIDTNGDSVLSAEERAILLTDEESYMYDLHKPMKPRTYCGYTAEGKSQCLKGYESADLSPQPHTDSQQTP